jgi:hypothetical protein
LKKNLALKILSQYFVENKRKLAEFCLKITQIPGEITSRLGSDQKWGEIS